MLNHILLFIVRLTKAGLFSILDLTLVLEMSNIITMMMLFMLVQFLTPEIWFVFLMCYYSNFSCGLHLLCCWFGIIWIGFAKAVSLGFSKRSFGRWGFTLEFVLLYCWSLKLSRRTHLPESIKKMLKMIIKCKFKRFPMETCFLPKHRWQRVKKLY